MVEVLQEFGFRVPILAKSDGEIIDGHLRYKAAQSMGLTEVPVILADDMSEAQIRAFRIMINRSANWAEWDEDLLLDELKAVELSDLDIKFTGFDMDELAKEVASQRASNMVLLGAAAPFIDLEPEKIEEGIRIVFGKKGEAIVESNIKAFRAGLEKAKSISK